MMELRSRKGLTALIGAGLIGVSTIGGCVSPEEQLAQGSITEEDYQRVKREQNSALTSLVGGVIGGLGAQRGKPGAIVLGQAISNHGAAQAARSEVNVYNNPSQSQPVYVSPPQQPVYVEPVNNPQNGPHSLDNSRFGEIIVGTFNYCFDFDNDGIIEWDNEYQGIKDYFNAGEKITVSLGSSRLMGDLSYKLVDSNGDVVDQDSIKERGVEESYSLQRVYNGNGNSPQNKALAPGSYCALWYAGNEPLAQWQFMVKE